MTPDVLDEHFYMSAEKSFSAGASLRRSQIATDRRYLSASGPRAKAIPRPNLEAALADAAWLTGLERNSDLVVMASYAPLFVNVNPGGMQWATDLIGYNALSSYGSPSYWMQVMFSTHLGTEVVSRRPSANAPPRVYASVTRDEATHKLFVKVVNATSIAQPLAIDLTGVSKVAPQATLITLSGKTPNATNSITHPDAVVPVERTVSVARTEVHADFRALFGQCAGAELLVRIEGRFSIQQIRTLPHHAAIAFSSPRGSRKVSSS